LENLWTSGIGDTFHLSVLMTELAATLKLGTFLPDFTPKKKVISFEQCDATHTLITKLFLHQLTAESIGPTAKSNKLRTNCRTPTSTTLEQFSSNFSAPEAKTFGKVCFQFSRPILFLPTVTARVLWVGAVRLQPFNGTWFGTCVILFCGPSFSGGRVSIINVPIW
jgi:hypothetical protein